MSGGAGSALPGGVPGCDAGTKNRVPAAIVGAAATRNAHIAGLTQCPRARAGIGKIAEVVYKMSWVYVVLQQMNMS